MANELTQSCCRLLSIKKMSLNSQLPLKNDVGENGTHANSQITVYKGCF